MRKTFGKIELMEDAFILGAVTYRIYFVTTKIGYYASAADREEFAFHFFDKNDEEIGYFNVHTYDMLGLTTFDEPRIWGDHFKSHPSYSAPMTLEVD